MKLATAPPNTAADGTRAASLLAELEGEISALPPEVLLELRPTVARIDLAIVSTALSAALGVAKTTPPPDQEYGLAEAAGVLGRSERWLRGHRKQLRIGYQLGGRGPWRFTQRELERVREIARRRAR